MQEYIFNFFVWYYFYKVQSFIKEGVVEQFIFRLNSTNALPMAQNLFVPMFQDKTLMGRFIGFFIRFWWMTFGIIISIILTIPSIILLIFLLILPFLPIIELIHIL